MAESRKIYLSAKLVVEMPETDRNATVVKWR